MAMPEALSSVKTAAWSWILGHLPPPQDVELHLICPVVGLKRSRVDFEWRDAHWHCFRQHRYELLFLWFRMYFAIRKMVRRLKPDVIHGWGGETGCGWLATLLSRQAVVSVQGLLRLFRAMLSKSSSNRRFGPNEIIVNFLEALSYGRACVCLCESETSAKALEHYYGMKSVVVAHPLRPLFYERHIPVKPDVSLGRRVLFVGQMTERKGPLDAIHAFESARSPRDELVMIGAGPLSHDVRALVEQLKLSNVVRFIENGSSEVICQQMQCSHIFLLPSYGDTGPTALKEAYSQGCVAVCYNNTGPCELVTRYGNGYLAKTGDVDDLTDKLKIALKAVSEDSGGGGLGVAATVRKDLSSAHVWRTLLSVYEKVRLS